ncbi:MAG: hypothetical protein ACKO81_06720, partial [Planctomycetota bacterium]
MPEDPIGAACAPNPLGGVDGDFESKELVGGAAEGFAEATGPAPATSRSEFTTGGGPLLVEPEPNEFSFGGSILGATGLLELAEPPANSGGL